MNAANKEVDTTFLSLDLAHERGFIHRDYIAHCLRWSHVVKYLSGNKRYQTTRLLDIGCGRELPLAKTLYSSRLILEQYYGVDYGPIEDSAMAVFKTGKFPLKVWEKCDFLEITVDDVLPGYPEKASFAREVNNHLLPNVITCFEVLEHVEPAHMLKILAHAKSLLSPDGVAFFSTPCWNVTDCAANHVNEMKYEALGAVFERNGWTVRNVWGTFASIRDYQHLLGTKAAEPLMSGERNKSLLTVFEELRSYYDSNVLSCIFAPLFPAQSRNCLWELVPHAKGPTKVPKLEEIPIPWGSSAKWEQMAS